MKDWGEGLMTSLPHFLLKLGRVENRKGDEMKVMIPRKKYDISHQKDLKIGHTSIDQSMVSKYSNKKLSPGS